MRRAKNAAAWRLLAEARLGSRQFPLACEAIDRAIRLRPDNPHYQMLRGICLKEAGSFQQAVETLDEYLRGRPRDIRAHDALKVCHYRLGDEQRALAAGRQKLVLLDPQGDSGPRLAFRKRPDSGKRVFSFSLWGNSELYCCGAMVNLRLARIFFPGWVCRFYVSDDVPAPDGYDTGIVDFMHGGDGP